MENNSGFYNIVLLSATCFYHHRKLFKRGRKKIKKNEAGLCLVLQYVPNRSLVYYEHLEQQALKCEAVISESLKLKVRKAFHNQGLQYSNLHYKLLQILSGFPSWKNTAAIKQLKVTGILIGLHQGNTTVFFTCDKLTLATKKLSPHQSLTFLHAGMQGEELEEQK